MFKKRFGLTTMALAAALALFTPVMASAHDRDDYRHQRSERRDRCVRGYRGRDGCWHRY
jgi:hypothetical protein